MTIKEVLHLKSVVVDKPFMMWKTNHNTILKGYVYRFVILKIKTEVFMMRKIKKYFTFGERFQRNLKNLTTFFFFPKLKV